MNLAHLLPDLMQNPSAKRLVKRVNRAKAPASTISPMPRGRL